MMFINKIFSVISKLAQKWGWYIYVGDISILLQIYSKHFL